MKHWLVTCFNKECGARYIIEVVDESKTFDNEPMICPFCDKTDVDYIDTTEENK